VLCVAIALAAWLIGHRTRERSQHEFGQHGYGEDSRPAAFSEGNRSAESEAQATAERFLKYRDAGDFEAAWKDLSPASLARAGSIEERTKMYQEWTKKYGEARTHRLESCTPAAGGALYVCVFTVTYSSNLSSTERVEMKTGAGRWAVTANSRTTPK
jgi:hypothetical protein